MRDGQVCVLIRYTVGKPLSLEGEGKRVPCLLRENEKTRRWSIAEVASESTKASLLIWLQETLIVQHYINIMILCQIVLSQLPKKWCVVAKECINDSGRQWYKNSWIFRCQLDVLLGNYGSFGSPGVRCAPSPSLGRVKMLGRLGQNLNSESSVLHERRDNQRANRINLIQQWRMVYENHLCNAV